VEQAGIEEIGRLPPCFGRKLAEFQHSRLYGKRDKLLPQIAHSAPISVQSADILTGTPMPKIISANLNGIRSAAKKGFFNWMGTIDADIICVQELKAQAADMTEEFLNPHGYHGHFHYAEKKGYSGTGIYSKVAPDRVEIGFGSPEFDAEGRYVRADFGNLTVISVYCPSGSSSEERQLAKFRFMDLFLPHLQQRRLEHRPQRDRPEKLEGQPEEFRLPA
jgi:hypothetical protein